MRSVGASYAHPFIGALCVINEECVGAASFVHPFIGAQCVVGLGSEVVQFARAQAQQGRAHVLGGVLSCGPCVQGSHV